MMPSHSFEVDPKRQLVSIRWKFAPSVQDWYDITECILGHPDYQSGMNLIAYRDEGLEPPSAEHVRQVLAVLGRRSERMVPVSLAIVAPASCDFGMARMMETLSESASIVVRAFRRSDDAIKWLEQPMRYEYPVSVAVA
jgi:hypothetical protein